MSETATLLLIEDDKNILRTNRRILEREGFNVLCAGTLAQAREYLAVETPDALILDILLPDGSGLEFCEELRSKTPAPMLFLTALDEKQEVVKGLRAGGNDYITKPYDIEEFLARVYAQLCLAQMNRETQNKILECGALKLDLAARRAYLRGEDLLLTGKEYALLLLLVRREGETLSAEYLYNTVWGLPMLGDNRTLRKHLSGLRKKLEDSGSPYTITSVYGKGYCFEKSE